MKNKFFRQAFLVLIILFAVSVFAAACGGKTSEKAHLNDEYALVLDKCTVNNNGGTATVTDANGKSVVLDEDGSFIATTLGAYSVKTSDGEYNIFVYEKVPVSEYRFSEDINGMVFSAGEVLRIPSCIIENRVGIYKDYTVTLKSGTEVIDVFSNPSMAQTVLRESGEYSLEYSNQNVFGTIDVKTVNFSVRDVKTLIFVTDIPKEVSIGEELTFDAFGYYLSQDYPVSLTLTKPSGNITEGLDVLFDEEGEYSLSFSSVVAGEQVVVEKTVDAKNTIENLFSSASNINYIEENSYLNEYCVGNEEAEIDKAVLISAANSSSSIMYSKVVDLREFNKTDNLFRAWIDKSNGQLSVLQFTLIDAYNPSINIRIKWWQNPWNVGMSYMHCSVNYQTYIGLSHNVGDIWGTYGSECGCNYTEFYSSGSFNMQFDWEEQCIYRDNSVAVLKLLDVNNLPSGFVWNGFTTGEVYLRIDFLNCVNGAIFLTDMGGQSLQDINYTDFIDDNAILINEDLKDLPDGVKDVSYSLPEYIKNKSITNQKVEIKVYFGDSSKPIATANGCFVPTEVGTYTVVYQTVDSVGSVFEKSAKIKVNEKPNPIIISGIPTEDSIDIMSYYSLPRLTIRGGNGEVTVKYTVKSGERELFAEDGKYLVDGADDLTVKVSAVDRLGFEMTESYKVTVNSDIRIFYSDPLPEYVFAGDTLNLSVRAVNYATGNTLKCFIYVNSNAVDGGEYVVPDNVSELKIMYFAKGEGISERSQIKTVKVLDRLTTVKDYVIVDKPVKKTILSSGVVYYLNDASYNMKLPYYLAANQFGFRFGFNENKDNVSKITFTLYDSKNKDNKVTFTLTDFASENISIKINGDDKVYYTKWQTSAYRSKFANAENIEKYAGTSYKFTDLLFDIGSLALTNGAGTEIAVFRYDAFGNIFKGFESGVVGLSYELDGVSRGTEFIVCMVGNQTFGYLVHGDDGVTDNNAPVIAFTEKLKNTAYYGETYELPAVKAYDVLSLAVNTYVSVYSPSGKVLVNKSKTDEDIYFTLSEYGNYRISFTVSDKNGQSNTTNFFVKVEYDGLPELAVNGEPNKIYKKGDIFRVPEYSVKANSDAGEIKSYVYLRLPTGKLIELDAGDEYVLEMKGEYLLIFRAVDSYYNVTRTVYSLTVD